ncbi:MAG: phytoene/squalene synthase family protein [Labrys sp. (in: a-proteobacteria)]
MPQPWDDPSSSAGHDYRACRALIRQGSRSFYAASLLLPMSVRMPACALYAFCRLSDDAVDAPDARRDAIEGLRDRLNRAYAGTPRAFAADRAFADVVDRFDLPKALPLALLDGLAWDAEGRRCATRSDLFAYSARVAAAVGAMMTVLMGVRDAATLARACDLGVAMQLTNIARDIGEDARNGRLYLPLDWLDDVGLDPEAFLAEPRFDARVAALTRRLLDEAEMLYARSITGIAGLPFVCRPAIHAARLIYREIGEAVRANALDSVSQRAFVPDGRKIALVATALTQVQWGGRPSPEPALAETQFLVDAVPAAAVAAPSGARPVVARRPMTLMAEFDRRVGRMIEIMGEAERGKRAAFMTRTELND